MVRRALCSHPLGRALGGEPGARARGWSWDSTRRGGGEVDRVSPLTALRLFSSSLAVRTWTNNFTLLASFLHLLKEEGIGGNP